MNGKTVRAFRRQADAAGKQATANLAPAVNAAIQNETLTRGRVEAAEARLVELGHQWAAFRNAGLRARLRWLILGR